MVVVSSTVLYVNLLLYLDTKVDATSAQWYLNPLIFMGNLDSILNDLGLLLVGGFFKQDNILRLVGGSTSSSTKPEKNLKNGDGSWNYSSETDASEGKTKPIDASEGKTESGAVVAVTSGDGS
jgi:hypothetical protein